MKQDAFSFTIPYVAELNDSLPALALRYNSSVRQIAELSFLRSNSLIPGQRLEIPFCHRNFRNYHTVRPWESLEDIAARYHTGIDGIRNENMVDSASPGDTLMIDQIYTKIFFVHGDNPCLKEELKKIEYPVEDIRKVALRELFHGLSLFTRQNVHLRSFSEKDGLAVIDVANLRIVNGTGSLIEELVIESILKTLSSYKEIRQVYLMPDGTKAETMNGHMIISDPLDVQTA